MTESSNTYNHRDGSDAADDDVSDPIEGVPSEKCHLPVDLERRMSEHYHTEDPKRKLQDETDGGATHARELRGPVQRWHRIRVQGGLRGGRKSKRMRGRYLLRPWRGSRWTWRRQWGSVDIEGLRRRGIGYREHDQPGGHDVAG